MDFNTFFIRFGLDSSNFTNKPVETFETPTGFIYEADLFQTKRTKDN